MPSAGKTPQNRTLHKQSLAFGGLVLQQLPVLSDEQMQYYIRNPKSLRNMLSRAFGSDVVDTLNQDLIPWQKTYQKLFGRIVDLSGLVIPPKPKGRGPMRLIVVAREILDWTNNLPIQGTLDSLRKYFSTDQWDENLDSLYPTHDRTLVNGSYAVWVKNVREADKENRGKTMEDLRAVNHRGITLLERILLEADYFFEQGEHLDQENVTLCSGSINVRGGYVPLVSWSDFSFGVGLSSGSDDDPRFSSRSVWF